MLDGAILSVCLPSDRTSLCSAMVVVPTGLDPRGQDDVVSDGEDRLGYAEECLLAK